MRRAVVRNTLLYIGTYYTKRSIAERSWNVLATLWRLPLFKFTLYYHGRDLIINVNEKDYKEVFWSLIRRNQDYAMFQAGKYYIDPTKVLYFEVEKLAGDISSV